MLGSSDRPPRMVDRLGQAAHHADIGILLEDGELVLKATSIGDIVCVHACDDWRCRGPRRSVGTQRRAQVSLQFDQPDAGVARCPFPQPLGRAVGRCVVKNDELEVVEGLIKNALHRRVEMRQRIVNWHDHTEWRGIGS